MSDEDAKAEAAMAGDEEAGSKARKRGQSLIQEHKDDGKKEGGGGGGKKEEDQNRICVFARLRPVFKRDREDPTFEHIVNLQPDKKTISLTGGKTYVYDGTFGEKSEQVPVWVSVGKPVVENVFKGYCGCVMAYGQTGTGKSHTMSNMDRGQEGVVMQSMMHIFNKMENDTEREYDVLFSYLQIYLDKVQDLMSPASGNLDIVRSESGEVSIPGLVQKECRTRERFIELYEEGDQHRIVAATKMNPVSSRSHSCLMIQIKSKPRGDDGTGETRTAKMWMIDLAGYERFSKTGVLEGIRKEEAKGINASLLSLGNVIQALADKEKHIPWRNAKLTRLLQDAIGGKSKAAVCITLGPSGASFHETVGTLYFGRCARETKTKNKPMLIRTHTHTHHTSHLTPQPCDGGEDGGEAAAERGLRAAVQEAAGHARGGAGEGVRPRDPGGDAPRRGCRKRGTDGVRDPPPEVAARGAAEEAHRVGCRPDGDRGADEGERGGDGAGAGAAGMGKARTTK